MLRDPAIVRNHLKVRATVSHARALLNVQNASGSFRHGIRRFIDGKAKQNRRRCMQVVPAHSAAPGAMNRDFRKRGLRFVGSTTRYAFVQEVGMVNDRTTDCLRHRALNRRHRQ